MEEIEKYKRLILPVLKRYFIQRAAIFGSLAKNELKAGSDIDLLIEPGKDFTLFKIKFDKSKLFGKFVYVRCFRHFFKY